MVEVYAGPPIGLVATDLDGTLLGSDHTLGPRDRAALHALGRAGVVRMVATGRSLVSARRVLDPNFPIDYLAVSSGSAILDWRSQRFLHAPKVFDRVDATRVAREFVSLGLNFMIHLPEPESHRFWYYRARTANADFDRRIGRYSGSAKSWDGAGPLPSEVSQFVAITRPEEVAIFERVRAELHGITVIRSTSPLDGRSLWIETYPLGVGKDAAVRWVAGRHHLDAAATASVGNDFNDRSMLDWTRLAFVVGNAAPELRERYRVVSSNDCGGFSDAMATVRREGGGFTRTGSPTAGVN